MAASASACSGRVLVRGRELLPEISVLSAASRSVSWPRRWAMPLSLDTDPGDASAASAATDGVSSPTARKSTSNPSYPVGPRTSRDESA
ncbi:Uncharacterised protein [Mycobacterium tuberculosis]|nr:Uncharacterised protein [Mycobacterium tuberculosis]